MSQAVPSLGGGFLIRRSAALGPHLKVTLGERKYSVPPNRPGTLEQDLLTETVFLLSSLEV